LPAAGLTLGREASLTPAQVSATHDELRVDRYDARFNLLSFELDFWGRLKSLTDAALAAYLASDEARLALRLTLVADVANAYLSLEEMDERLALARETVRSREETQRLIALRREVGLAGDLDF